MHCTYCPQEAAKCSVALSHEYPRAAGQQAKQANRHTQTRANTHHTHAPAPQHARAKQDMHCEHTLTSVISCERGAAPWPQQKQQPSNPLNSLHPSNTTPALARQPLHLPQQHTADDHTTTPNTTNDITLPHDNSRTTDDAGGRLCHTRRRGVSCQLCAAGMLCHSHVHAAQTKHTLKHNTPCS